MDWYYYVAAVVVLTQLLFLVQVFRNYHYVMGRYQQKRLSYRPAALLIVPCKGLDSDFEKNITSFFKQEYENYQLWFVVGDKSDPAYARLGELANQLTQHSMARDVKIWVAGRAVFCGQKVHNLLYCCRQTEDNVEVLAFADSDACVGSDWLSHLVFPLKDSKNGAAGGYRWFIPKKNNVASLALSAVNAKVAQLLGNTHFNQAWGGSMAIRADFFRRTGMDRVWSKTLSDDLSLSSAVKKAGKKVVFVPACLVASHATTTWPKLFDFARRQFLITRINAPGTWWFGFFSSVYSVLGLWGTAALAVYAAAVDEKNLLLFISVPVMVFASQMARAIIRQTMIAKLLRQYRHKMRAACVADVFFFWVWSMLMLVFIMSSAFGRTICWRGIRYKLVGPTETIVIDSQ